MDVILLIKYYFFIHQTNLRQKVDMFGNVFIDII